MKYIIAPYVFALLTAKAESIKNIPHIIYPAELHWNEDPHSRADPQSGTPYKTSTQARFESEGSDANKYSVDQRDQNPSTKNAYRAYNTNDKEPTLI
tara:strand:- start:168 stop:458 length:291 start_codon:yes stop_codon:yes gene_type:complete